MREKILSQNGFVSNLFILIMVVLVIGVTVTLLSINKNYSVQESPLPSNGLQVETTNQQNWLEAKKMISDCEVKTAIENHKGELDLRLNDESIKNIGGFKESNRAELYKLTEASSKKCGFEIIAGIE